MKRDGTRFQFDRAKFKELVLYVAQKCPPERLGAVKFNKVLYYSDMLHYVSTGQPLTGAVYRRRNHGPTTDHLLSALRDLAGDGAVEIAEVNFFGFKKKEYRARRAADLDRFTAEEIALIDDMIQFVCEDHTAKGISELSHNLAWESTEPGAEIPYFTAFLMFPTEVSESTFDMAEREAPAIEAERQKSDPLGYPLFSDLRARL